MASVFAFSFVPRVSNRVAASIDKMFCKDVLQALPMDFAMEAQQLVAISLEGSVG